MLTKRFRIKNVAPNGYKAVLALENYICNSKINPVYREMIKIRASQINGCAYCIDPSPYKALSLPEQLSR